MTSKWFETVQKLLAKAEDPAASEGEAASFREAAERLIIKYSIDRAALEAAGEVEKDEIITKPITFEGSYILDRIVLMHNIATALGCQGVKSFSEDALWQRRSGKRVQYDTYVVMGWSKTIETVEFLYASLTLQMQREAAQQPTPRGLSRVSFLKGFHAGFANAVNKRLKEIHHRVMDEAEPGKALAVVDKTKAVEHAFQERYGKKSRAAARQINYTGWGEGHSAGQRADLNQTRVGGQRTVLNR